MRVEWVRLAFLAIGVLEASAAGGDFNGPVSFVPWKVIAPGDSPAKAPMTLYWIPASRDDFKRSELLFSRPLTAYASQCVAMQVIRADDAARIEKLGAAGALPIAVLLDGDGKQLGKVDNDRGALNVSAVEKLVRDQLRAGEAILDARLEDARRKASAGDRDSAVATYKSICDLRCVFPRKAKEAERELKRLDSLAANR
jgi:hypothetical protein